MGKLSSFFRNKGLRFKLLIYFIILILLPFTTLGILGNVVFSNTIEDEANRNTTQMIEQVKKNVEFYIKDMENSMYIISKDPQVVHFLTISSSDPSNENVDANVRQLLAEFTDVHPEIAGILIANDNDASISNELYRVSKDPLTTEIWYQQAIKSPNQLHLISKPIGRNIATFKYIPDDIVSVTKAIQDPVSGEYRGVIIIDLKLAVMENVIKGVTPGKNGFIYIMDTNGDAVYAPENPIVYRVRENWLSGSPDNTMVKRIRGNLYQIIYSSSEYTGWKFIGVFSLNEALQEVIGVRNFSLLVGSSTLIFAILVALFFTNSIVKPIGKLRKLMKIAEDGNLNVFFNSHHQDEIGQLGNSFNNMIGEIRKLIDMVYHEQKSKREAELKTLQAQIKPHFLYNTLDTIQWMAQEGKTHGIVELVSALTNVFRIGLSKGKENVSIRDELDHVRSYLVIQKARYEDKLEFEINFDSELLDCLVLKLVLQPLVENAIYHGIKARRGGGLIVVTAAIVENKLLFRVEDNGVGITPDRMDELNKMLESELSEHNKPGYGAFNVNERIKLSFGAEFGLQFKSEFGKGTTVEVWHPLITG